MLVGFKTVQRKQTPKSVATYICLAKTLGTVNEQDAESWKTAVRLT